jgi:hypothetical protein
MTQEQLIKKLQQDRTNLTTLIGTLIHLSMHTKALVEDKRMMSLEKAYELRDHVDMLLRLHS